MSFRCFGVAVLTLALNSVASATELLVPAYFYPSFDPAQNYWNDLTAAAAAGARVTAIMNPDNGPGASFNSDYEGECQDSDTETANGHGKAPQEKFTWQCRSVALRRADKGATLNHCARAL